MKNLMINLLKKKKVLSIDEIVKHFNSYSKDEVYYNIRNLTEKGIIFFNGDMKLELNQREKNEKY